MKIYTKPKVYLISRPELDLNNITEFLIANESVDGWVVKDEPGDGELLPEFAGRMCYNSFGAKQGRKRNDEYLANIIEQKHGSVLEHSNWTFLVTRASRGFTHEMVRHRAGFAYSQESTHFIDYTDPKFWSLCLDPRLGEHIKDMAVASAEDSFQKYGFIYKTLINSKYKRKTACSMARQVLPIGIESKLAFTGNARALRHFMEYRGNSHNVFEIRMIALFMLEILQLEAPAIFGDIETKINPEDGFNEIVSKNRKV